MVKGLLFAFILLLALTVLVRRFSSRRRDNLETYIHRHEQEAHSRIEAMRLETRRFNAHEALAPVEAGLRELLALHGNPSGIGLDREDDALILHGQDVRISVIWNFRAASRIAPVQAGHASAHIYGKGQWELRVADEAPEVYTRLDGLMGRLSPLVRSMTACEPITAAFPRPGP